MKSENREATVMAIYLIKKSMALVKSHKMLELSGNLDLWDKGIHLFMSSDLPFTHSFDEVMYDISKEEELLLEPKMMIWLRECLDIANSHLMLLIKENKNMPLVREGFQQSLKVKHGAWRDTLLDAKIISKKEVVERVVNDCRDDFHDEIMNSSHEIVELDGVLYWKPKEIANEIYDGMTRENDEFSEVDEYHNLHIYFWNNGIFKNDEAYRDTFRNLGWRLTSYWEYFYYHNDDAEEYEFNIQGV